jgi:hypothetical protein
MEMSELPDLSDKWEKLLEELGVSEKLKARAMAKGMEKGWQEGREESRQALAEKDREIAELRRKLQAR